MVIALCQTMSLSDGSCLDHHTAWLMPAWQFSHPVGLIRPDGNSTPRWQLPLRPWNQLPKNHTRIQNIPKPSENHSNGLSTPYPKNHVVKLIQVPKGHHKPSNIL